MPLPQDIRPFFQDIQDTLTRADSPWIETTSHSKVRILWIGRESGSWASVIRRQKGYAAPPHKHLAGAHVLVLSGKLQVRGGVLNAGDYVYEPAGVLHEETRALEDTDYLFIATGRTSSSTITASPTTTIGKSWSGCAPRPTSWRKRPSSAAHSIRRLPVVDAGGAVAANAVGVPVGREPLVEPGHAMHLRDAGLDIRR
jgi:hypothetical protein